MTEPATGPTTGPTTGPVKTLPLVFDEPRGRRKPPRHLADLDAAGRKELLEKAGLPGFRAKQLSTHYFSRLVDDHPEIVSVALEPAVVAPTGVSVLGAVVRLAPAAPTTDLGPRRLPGY